MIPGVERVRTLRGGGLRLGHRLALWTRRSQSLGPCPELRLHFRGLHGTFPTAQNPLGMARRWTCRPIPQPPLHRLEAVSADRELMRAVARKDRQAFKALYERYAPRIGAYLMKLLKRHELVDETVNDVMLAVWQYADRFDPEQGPLLTWLFGIAHNKGLKALRSAGRFRAEVSVDPQSPAALDDADGHEDGPQPVAPHQPERTVLGWELGQALAGALDQLSPDHRAVIELTFGEERSYPEIAQILDCPLNTVKTRMFHARKKLAQLLAQRGHAVPAAT